MWKTGFKLWGLLVLLLILTPSILAGISKPFSFTEFLRKSEDKKVLVKFDSSGCFHWYTNLFEFQGDLVTIYEIDRKRSKVRNHGYNETKKKLGALTLSADDLEGLEHLFSFYEAKPRGGCTTVNRISLMQPGSENDVARGYIDGSCGYGQNEKVMSFWRLKQRLEKD
ncbi:hypothetical protein QSV34_08940 [Porticoccus sp. W117]|uniref:hypothetical protein n=1 Tax=Porticoccus sp. W117 TaxID=3054777 RepID=UPI0025957440|nr:hypothetical protein [Porticoccus sp. W117]MDM3871480.1 hypothetical protein [Porticoccus sp. W117]